MSPRKPSKREEDKNDYFAKRSRNNEAVRRSREKGRQEAKETHDKVSQLKQENEMLEERIQLLTKELTFLNDIFLAHAGKY
jgi:CCAAT/enhancer binding protein (C/EBP) gamma